VLKPPGRSAIRLADHAAATDSLRRSRLQIQFPLRLKGTTCGFEAFVMQEVSSMVSSVMCFVLGALAPLAMVSWLVFVH
jgi:hypothetical protein